MREREKERESACVWEREREREKSGKEFINIYRERNEKKVLWDIEREREHTFMNTRGRKRDRERAGEIHQFLIRDRLREYLPLSE